MTKTLEEIYTAEWFDHDFRELGPEFELVADALYRQFGPDKVVDIGCGPGMILRRLAEHGCQVYGVEGSAHGIAYADDSIRGAIEHDDITTIEVDGYFDPDNDLVICTEVAEHLDAEHAPHLVALLCSALCPIVFTAAPPGQDGHHHVNCQPKSYWEELFAAYGALPDRDATLELQMRWRKLRRLSHMTSNVTVYR